MFGAGRCINVEDFRRLARRRLPDAIVDFFDGAAEDEHILLRNRTSFAAWALLPKSMRDVSSVSAATRVLGQDVAWPFVVGPTGMPGLLHPDGEIGIARAAERAGALNSLSTMASRSIEEVAAATAGPKAFQLYLFRDRGITLELIQRAKAAGYKALILTVDVQVPANRERDRRNGMTIPPKFALRTMLDFARHPRWCWNVLVKRPVVLANFSGNRADPGVPLLTFINQQFDPSIGWHDLEWVAKHWSEPLAITMAVGRWTTPSRRWTCCPPWRKDWTGAPRSSWTAGCAAEPICSRRSPSVLRRAWRGGWASMGWRAGGSAGAEAVLGALRAEFERDLALLGARDRLRDRPLVRACARRTCGVCPSRMTAGVRAPCAIWSRTRCGSPVRASAVRHPRRMTF